jgi:nucleotide-binding universal stress UspA family protein
MLRNIVVGLSGSEYSRAAVEVALAWAQRYQAGLLGVAVVDVPGLAAAEPVPLGAGIYKVERDELILKNAREQAARLLDEFAKRATTADVPFHTSRLEGDPATLLAREAQRGDLLIVGRRAIPQEFGHSPSHTLHALLHSTSRPVICVPASSDGGAPALVAYDGSAQAAKSLQAFQAIGLASRRDIHVLTVAHDPRDRHLGELAVEYLKHHGHEVRLHVESTRGPAASVILGEAKRLGAGIIVMGSFGQSQVKEFFFGSVTKSVLRDSTVPLFLYH